MRSRRSKSRQEEATSGNGKKKINCALAVALSFTASLFPLIHRLRHLLFIHSRLTLDSLLMFF